MASVELIVTPDPARLLEHAAAEFLVARPGAPEAPFPSPPCLLAVRQGGVRDDLLALAAARGIPGWFDPPLCVFTELPEWLGRTTREPCGEFERVVLVAAAVRRAARAVFGRLRHSDAFVEAVDRWFGELASEGVTADAYDAALARLGTRDEFDRGRDADLGAAYRWYQAELAAAGRRDGRDTLADCAAAVAADPLGLDRLLGGRRDVRIFGLGDLRGGWRGLLRALAACPALDRLAIYAAQPLPLPDDLGAAVTLLDGEASAPAARPRLLSAADAPREAEEVARRVRDLADRGVAPARIAVVARQSRPYQDLVVRALERVGVPATARRRVAYREIPVLRSVFALFDAAAEGWSRHGLVELAEQPYFANELDGLVLNAAGYRARITGLAAWGTALADLEREARRHDEAVADDEWRRPPLPPRARIERARARFPGFATLAEGLEGERPLTAWLEWLRDFLAHDPWKLHEAIHQVPARRYDLARIDLRGLRDLAAAVREWLAALERWGGGEERLAIGAFRARLADVLAGDAVLWTSTQRGVMVLEAHGAAYRRFDHVFLVGLSADRFPARPPTSPLFDPSDHDALIAAGLPLEPRSAWGARERDLFRVLVAGSGGSVTVSYPRLDDAGWELIRSTLVDELVAETAPEEEHVPASRVVTPGVPLVADAGQLGHAERVARMELARRAGVPSPYNGRIEDPALRDWLQLEFGDSRVWSPTQLEAYARCPWAYFSGRLLRIEKREEPDTELDPLTKGLVLHDALARFFAGAAERVGGPVVLRASDLAWARPLALAALDHAVAAAGADTWLGHPALRAAKRDELRRTLEGYLEFEADYNDRMFNPRSPNAHLLRTGAAAHELAFEDAVLERGGLRIRFRGAMDRVDVAVDDRISDHRFVAAIDYKSSLAAVPGGGDDAAWDDGVVLQVPLYAHALAALRAGARVARVQYRALRPPQVAHSLELFRVDRKTKVLHPDAAGQARLERALDAAVAHVQAARAGVFPAAPKPSCGCPPFCHAWDICRVPGGPRVKWDV